MNEQRDEPPVWLLDVDGVLNAVTADPDRHVWPDWQRVYAAAHGVSWPIWFSPSVTGTITRLQEAGLADVRWLTTWGDDANDELRRRLELPRLAVAGRGGVFDVAVDEVDWWKFGVVRALHRAAPERRLIWTDDDLRHLPEVQAWMRANTRSLVIAPDPDVGLSPDQLDEIRRFCADPALDGS